MHHMEMCPLGKVKEKIFFITINTSWIKKVDTSSCIT